MRNFFIIHASDENSQTHWTPWLKKQLETRGYECITPDFPCENGHILVSWYQVIEQYLAKITTETVFIGHSRGFPFVLNLLMDYELKTDTLYGVGGFIEYLFYPKKEGGTDTFFARPFDYALLKSRCKHFVDFESDNDPYVPLAMAKKIEHELASRLVIIPNGKHFRTVDGYQTFPQLFKDIMDHCK